MTRIIELPLPEELLRLVDEKAQTAGLRRETYIRSVLSKHVSLEPSLSEILAPFRDQVAASGFGDEELDRLLAQAREDSHGESKPHQSC
jgi:hypothetical protein